MDSFGQFINYYYGEDPYRRTVLSDLKFLKDEVVHQFAVKTLTQLFEDPISIPKELVFAYFALLKVMETSAENN